MKRRIVFEKVLSSATLMLILLSSSLLSADFVAGERESHTRVLFDMTTRKETCLPYKQSTIQGDQAELDFSPSFEGFSPINEFSSDRPSGIEPNFVFPPDDRERVTNTNVFPWSTIVKLFIAMPDGALFEGSGAMIGGYHVLTAAHCVYSNAHGGWASVVLVIPGSNGTGWGWVQFPPQEFFNSGKMPFHYAGVTLMSTYSEWVDHEDENHDFALLTLDRQVGRYTGWLGLMTAPSDDPVYIGILHTAGYPGDRDSATNMYYDSDFGEKADTYAHYYYMDHYQGQSGSPVWVQYPDSGEYYVLSVVAYDWTDWQGNKHNRGTRLNNDKFNSLVSWMAEDPAPSDYSDLVWDGNYGRSPSQVVRAETNFNVWIGIPNIGTAPSGDFQVSYYASLGQDKQTSGDYIIGVDEVSSVYPFAKLKSSFSGPFPAYMHKVDEPYIHRIPVGTYWIVCEIDSAHEVLERHEDNNVIILTQVSVTNNPPVSDPGGPYWATRGVPMKTFGLGSYDLDGWITGYSWDFGDGSGGTGDIETHTYESVGTYVLTLTVTDIDGGVGTETTLVHVAEPLPWEIQVVDSTGSYTSIALDSEDRPHISYYSGGWQKYTRYEWAWYKDIVDSTGDVGRYSSIALDSAGNPHISYYDETNGDLKYAWWNISSWIVETVDWVGDVGQYTSIAIDANGRPHISYYDAANHDLKYAVREGTWTIVTVDSDADVGQYSSIAVDASNRPHISYYDAWNSNLKCTRWTGSNWDTSTVDAAGIVGEYTSIALDSSGMERISYYYRTGGDLKYARRITSSSWSVQTVDGGGDVGVSTSIALDSAGNPHISYMDLSNYDLKYARWNGTMWNIETVDWVGGAGWDSSIALDSLGEPHISYQSNGYLKYARLPRHPIENQPPVAITGGPYNGTEGVSVTFNGTSSFDPDQTIISYFWNFGDGTNATGATTAHTFAQQGNYTVVLTVKDLWNITDSDVSYVLINDTTPMANFYANYYVGNPSLAVTFTDTSSSYDEIISRLWDFGDGTTITEQHPTHTYAYEGVYTVSLTVETQDGDVGSKTFEDFVTVHLFIRSNVDSTGGEASIALDSGGFPRISYFNQIQGDLKYARWTGTVWIRETVESTGTIGQYASLALDSEDKPHISYYDGSNGNLKYAKWNGTTWIKEIVESAGNVGQYTSIELDTNGYPHISYYDVSLGDLKYAHWNGTAWIKETVDSTGNVGLYTSLALDSGGRPHISYYDLTNSDLKYAHWNGATWIRETVDSSGYVGLYSSLALDSTDKPHIGYYDGTNGDLRFARWNGASWVTETVDSAGSVGMYTSLALDSDDKPHISYYHSSYDDLKYARWDGSTWVVRKIDAIGGKYSSLALDSFDKPHICHFDATGFLLKHARLGSCDIAVTKVLPLKTIIGEGYSMPVNVTVQNQGEFTTTFILTAYYNSNVLDYKTVTLLKGKSSNISLTWSTLGFNGLVHGIYVISAKATPVSGETDTADNALEGGSVCLTISSDINGDKKVDVMDLYSVGKCFNTAQNNPQWDPNIDINNDGVINESDLAVAAENYGKSDL